MSSTLIAVVFALVIGHFLHPLQALRDYRWSGAWAGWLDGQVGEQAWWREWHGLLLSLGLPLLLVALVQWRMDGVAFGVPAFVFSVVVLFYSWGPRDLDRDVVAIVDAEDAPARQRAIEALLTERVVSDAPSLVEAVFDEAMLRWFSVIFWFLVLGPFGALAFRLLAQVAAAREPGFPSGQRLGAAWAVRVLTWPVAQLMSLSLALVANFDAVFTAWREWHAGGVRLDTGFLGAAARASVQFELAGDDDSYTVDGGEAVPALPSLPEVRDAMSLVWRMLLLWLALLALFVLAGWVN